MAFRNIIIENSARVSVKNHMLQYSVYVRVCNGVDAVEKHRARLKANLPDNGAIRMLVITEKQYEAVEVLLGKLTPADDSFQCEQLSIF